MLEFIVHTLESAPEKSKKALTALQSAFGFVPNIAGAMSASPVLIDSLVGLFQNVHGGTFDEKQIQVLLLTNAVTNSAEWAVAFHSFLASQEGIDGSDIQAIRDGGLPRDAKLAALSDLARRLIEGKGHLEERTVDAFLHAGFEQSHVLEVIAVVAASAITNYTASITKPPLEPKFASYSWQVQRS